MYCPSCGSQNADTAKFCSECGSALSQPAQAVPDDGKPVPPGGYEAQEQAVPVEPTVEATETINIDYSEGAPVQGTPAAPTPKNGKATGALVCGILAIVFSSSIIIGLILGIIAVVLGAQAVKVSPDGKAKAGKICGIIGIVLSAVLLIVSIAMGAAVFDMVMKNPDAINIEIGDKSKSKSSKSSSLPSPSDSKSAAPSTSKGGSHHSESSGHHPESSFEKYNNARFGYSLELPIGFEKQSEAANGDGAVFVNNTKKITVTVTGYNNTNNLTPEQIIEGLWNGSSESVMQNDSSSGYLFQNDGTTVSYYKVFVGKGSVDKLEITYPASYQNAEQIQLVEDLVDEFKKGDVNSAH